MAYIKSVETAPGYRVTLRKDPDGFYRGEAQQHISTASARMRAVLGWQFDRDGWRATTGFQTGSADTAAGLLNALVASQREYVTALLSDAV